MRTGQTTDETFVASTAEAIKAAMPRLDETDRNVATAIHRLMSGGEAVDPPAIAQAAGVSVAEVNSRLDSWPGVFRYADGQVAGFWGHAIAALDPEYRLVAGDATTYGWCALDTLFIPGIIGKTVRVEASDPVSGDAVSLTVDAAGARDVTPAGARVSMVVPDGPFGYDVIDSFCHRVYFFASEETGGKWVAEHPGTTLMSIQDAFELGRSIAP